MRILDPKSIPVPSVPGARGTSGLSIAGWDAADGTSRTGALVWFADDYGKTTGVLLTPGEFNALRDMLSLASPGLMVEAEGGAEPGEVA